MAHPKVKMNGVPYVGTDWHDAGIDVHRTWMRVKTATTMIDMADALVDLGRAMEDLETWLPDFDGDGNVVVEEEYHEAAGPTTEGFGFNAFRSGVEMRRRDLAEALRNETTSQSQIPAHLLERAEAARKKAALAADHSAGLPEHLRARAVAERSQPSIPAHLLERAARARARTRQRVAQDEDPRRTQ